MGGPTAEGGDPIGDLGFELVEFLDCAVEIFVHFGHFG